MKNMVEVPDETGSRLYRRAPAGFVKLFGYSGNRLPHSHPVIDEVRRAGCHWACCYPVAKRPRQVKDGDVIFMARLVSDPEDMRVFGRALAMEHRPGRDDATAEDIQLRPWKSRWPCYVRVHDAQFLNGTLRDGVSLRVMIDELQAESWCSTSRRAAGMGGMNIDPYASLSQQSHLQLTVKAIQWLNDHLDARIHENGRIDPGELAKLDWPKIPR
jgi:hypothetical protein